jgi:hypothetical protein
MENRSVRRRFALEDLDDFQILLTLGSDQFEGKLANISEQGLGAMLPCNLAPAAEARVVGMLRGDSRMPLPLVFQGTVTWFKHTILRGTPHTLLGVAFHSPIELPESLIAITMAVQSEYI